MRRLLLCTDLDRTLIPNGPQPLSPEARPLFAALAAREEISLAYVTGRHRGLIESAIREYALPRPDYAVADVGATVYLCAKDPWTPWDSWSGHLAPDWKGLDPRDLHALLADLEGLRLQEREKQGPHKLSYYVPLEIDHQALTDTAGVRLRQASIRANLVWSVDELAGVGLLDILPARAGKLSAIHFLMEKTGFGLTETVFAGDSGNDVDVLTSDIPAVLVANATTQVREMLANAKPASLYLARGWLGMNGNYAAGILEGAAHFWPEADAWLRELKQNMGD